MLGRHEEIRTLDEIMSRKEAQLVAVYGRRRVGKTYLIRQYFSGKFTFYHTGEANVGMKDQLLGFRDSLREYGSPEASVPTSWREAFQRLRELIESSTNERKVVFIDEMPWMDTPRSKFLSALERFWNGWGSSRSDLVMIVCGSASSWIVDNVIRNRGGLHNRITDQIHLHPFKLAECEQLAAEAGLGLSRTEVCEAYMVFGGVPYYWGFLRKGESVAQSIDRLFFSEGAKLRGEFESMLGSLFRKGEEHVKIIRALATVGIGLNRSELIKRAKASDGELFCKCLRALEECGFVRKYTAFGKMRRDSLYQLVDCFSLFYLRWVDGESNPDPHFWAASGNSPAKNAWRGHAFERICLLHISEIKRALQIGGVVTHVCSWQHRADDVYGKGAQIDLLIDRADQVIDVCEMKYSSRPYLLDKDEDESIGNRISAFETVAGTTKSVRLVVVAANGLVDNAYARKAHNIVSLNQLFDC